MPALQLQAGNYRLGGHAERANVHEQTSRDPCRARKQLYGWRQTGRVFHRLRPQQTSSCRALRYVHLLMCLTQMNAASKTVPKHACEIGHSSSTLTGTMAFAQGPKKENLNLHCPGRLEESFLMVPGTASAMRQGASQSLQASAPGYSVENIDEKFQQLARIFEIASGETRVCRPHICEALRTCLLQDFKIFSSTSYGRRKDRNGLQI